jgi:EAL domain-containing protein (putative c-di-GMP-specific phosphodiesterase class I)
MLKRDGISERGGRGHGANPSGLPARDAGIDRLIAENDLDILFQPWIEPATGRVIAAEALTRSALGSPTGLFARAASAGRGDELSQIVQAQAIAMAAAWRGPLAGLNLSLNLLPGELSRPGHDEWLLEKIAEFGLDPARLTLEITENDLLIADAEVAERLQRLRSAGIAIAIDDFGSGYASFAYLTTLPLDLIKVDRSLVAGLIEDDRNRIVMKALIALARDLGLKLLVEGVESAGQLALLAEWGCELYQGFFAAGALSEEELARFVASAQIEAA